MKRISVGSAIGIISVAVLLGWVTAVSAQTTFSSGSNGTLGAFAPGANTTVALPPDGILNYTTINIPAGVTVSFTPNVANTPVTMLATGNVTIAGTLRVDGAIGTSGSTTISGTPALNTVGRGGPGGFDGGFGGTRGLANTLGSAGLGPGGGVPTAGNNGGTYGAPATVVALLPLFGGSGGGGANADTTFSGSSGSGGGGAIVVASTTKITVSGTLTANGGNAPSVSGFCGDRGYAAPGSGGAIRLVAPEIVNTGTIQAKFGTDGQCGNATIPPGGGAGRIRLEALLFGTVATTDPIASVSTTLGPITPTSVPALMNFPILAFTSVGGVAPPPLPTGSFTTADVILPGTTTNPVSVILTATNTPAPTTYTVKLIPQFAFPSSQTVTSSGAFSLSTATATVTFPNGRISALQAFAGFTLTASLAPIIDGEPADQVLLAAGYGEPSTLTVVTKFGKEIPVSQLSQADQLKVALAFEAMRNETR